MTDHGTMKLSKGLFWAGVLAVGIAVLAALLPAIYHARAERVARERGHGEVSEDVFRIRASQRERLDGYGWTDREKQLVSIPIERAIDLVVEDAEAE